MCLSFSCLLLSGHVVLCVLRVSAVKKPQGNGITAEPQRSQRKYNNTHRSLVLCVWSPTSAILRVSAVKESLAVREALETESEMCGAGLW